MMRMSPVRAARILLLSVALLAQPAFASTIITREFDSSALKRQWRYAVYLPDGYESSQLRYPVLYLLHGNGGNLHSWSKDGRMQPTLDALIAKGEIKPAIVVMPDAGTTWFVDRKENMQTAFLSDLLPEVEREFRTINSREGRVIAGFSMGGFGALRFVLLHPEKFAAAGLLTPAIYDPAPPENSSARRVGVFGAPDFDPGVWRGLNYPTLWDAYLAKNQPVPMYISSGDDDEFFIEAEAAKLYALLRKHKLPGELRIVNGVHVLPAWENTIADAVRYVFRFASEPISAADTSRAPASR